MRTVCIVNSYKVYAAPRVRHLVSFVRVQTKSRIRDEGEWGGKRGLRSTYYEWVGRSHSPGVGYSGPPNPLKGLFIIDNAEKTKGSIPGGLGLEGLFLGNHRKSL